MPREKQIKPGMMVQLRQAFRRRDDVLPMMVTHVHDDGRISGVAFSGEPGAVAWNGDRGTQAFNNVVRGNGNREWQPYGRSFDQPDMAMEEDMPDPEPMDSLQDGDMPDDDMPEDIPE